jgi:UPF0755 protein
MIEYSRRVELVRKVGVLLVVLLLALGVLGGAAAWWVHQPLKQGADVLDLTIEPGSSPSVVALAVADAGVKVDPMLLYWWFRLSGESRNIKAGSYEIEPGQTPRTLLAKLVRGAEALRSITLIEGLTFAQIRQVLAKDEQLKQETRGLKPDDIMQKLGKPGLNPEGRFFPDTYTFAKGASDLAVLRLALRAMDKNLDAAWSTRQPDSPLKTPEQALILASIVEKETGQSRDRAQIAGVFINRLKIGMLLQTDPTVIYGMGEKFDGNLRKRDLQTDTPWNTYTRAGLPPTPIAMPGRAALIAAVQPAPTKALYFVARGDGTSQFSATLEEHNRAVNKYQRGK